MTTMENVVLGRILKFIPKVDLAIYQMLLSGFCVDILMSSSR